ncbi:MAG: hypothetical protein JO127_02440 [Caulobacteraceae bacterium]|nr:hypothetical protein [Caulobacteraceae bacterium]
MRIAILALVAAALCGCTTQQGMDARFEGLVGKPVKFAIDRLGPPTGSDETGVPRSYFWAVNHDETFSTAEPPNRFGINDPVAVSEGNTRPARTTTYHVQCWIRIEAGADGTITAYDWSKNAAGCGRFAARLGLF